jgi:hypothetical protein
VADQKQEVSWASSRHWLTSRVLFLPDLDKYGAVLDNNTVALWDAGDTLLANIKKYKVPRIKYRHKVGLRITQCDLTLGSCCREGRTLNFRQDSSRQAGLIRASVTYCCAVEIEILDANTNDFFYSDF